LLDTGAMKGLAHITGGGITDNLPRVLPASVLASVDLSRWQVPPIFQWLMEQGRVPLDDMLRTFNMGIGLILVVAPAEAEPVLHALAAAGEPRAVRIGEITAGSGQVRYS
jgi:phosphoribosylformylglycinamidine cyclo-ligase